MLANDSQYWVGSGWVQIFSLVVGWVEFGQSADGLGRVTENGPMDNSGIDDHIIPSSPISSKRMRSMFAKFSGLAAPLE